MSAEEKSYSREFKAKVVLETVSAEESTPQEVADKYEVSLQQILLWARELNISHEKLENIAAGLSEAEVTGLEDESDVISLDTISERFASEVEYGATYDILNIKRLTFWGVYGTILVLIFLGGLYSIYHFSSVSTVRIVSEQSVYYEMRERQLRDQETLSSFGVVDLESGIYRAPIDSVISRMSQDE